MNPPAVLAGFGEAENSGRTSRKDGPQGDATATRASHPQGSSSIRSEFCSERCWYGHEDGAFSATAGGGAVASMGEISYEAPKFVPDVERREIALLQTALLFRSWELPSVLRLVSASP
jgi:hypothetical protein